MPSGYGHWTGSNSGGGGGGVPWGLAIVAAAVVLVGTSAAFAEVIHDLMYAVLGVCALVTIAGLGSLGMVLHHQRAMRQPDPSVVLHLDARTVTPERQVRATGARQIPAPVSSPPRVISGRVIRPERATLPRKDSAPWS